MNSRTVGIVLVVLAAALFGTLGIFGRVAAGLELSMATLLGLRFVAATAVLWAVVWVRGRPSRLDARTVGIEIGLGCAYGVMSVAYFESLNWLSAGIAALLLFTYPVQVTLASAVTLEEPVTVPKLLALLSAVSGVALVVGGGEADLALVGVLLVGLASLCYTLYSMGTRVMTAAIDPLTHVAYTFLGVTATVLGYGVGTATLSTPATTDGWLLIGGITVVGTLAPIVLFAEGLSRIEASTASIVSTSEPLTTVLLGALLLGEAVTLSTALGAALIIAGVGLTSPAVERLGHHEWRPTGR
jgi:drug/metabolite transporter (DMT)-like permease